MPKIGRPASPLRRFPRQPASALLLWRAITHGCYVHAQEPRAQFREIVDRVDLRARIRPFTAACTAIFRSPRSSATK